jgi:putative transposase
VGGLGEFAYLAVVLDAFRRRAVGWALEAYLEARLAIAALTMALKARRPAPDSLIHHSDRGVQYACGDYTEILAAHGIRPSMSRGRRPIGKAECRRWRVASRFPGRCPGLELDRPFRAW